MPLKLLTIYVLKYYNENIESSRYVFKKSQYDVAFFTASEKVEVCFYGYTAYPLKLLFYVFIVDLIDMDKLILNWKLFGSEMDKVLNQLREGHSLAFAFVEGTLVKAIKNGEWILLDEINLATAETLECLSGLLESKAGSVVLVERG